GVVDPGSRRMPLLGAGLSGRDDGTDLRSFLHHQARRDGNGTLHQPLNRGRPWWPPLGDGERATGSRLPVRASGGRVRYPSKSVSYPSLAGRLKRKIAPRGEFFIAHSFPPWASMIEREIASPMPIPSDFVMYNGSNMCSALSASSPLPVPFTSTTTSDPWNA